ncbi:MAG TPA: hypothetical protein VGP18_03620 [Solirubrobacteraceae bacterium]|nr:hypothetical protein [Solirubrobacteraceae bacterium]
MLEERQERGLGLDRHHAVLVEPHAAEDEAEELALGGGVGLGGPEHREVLEHLAGLVEVRGWLGRECVKLGVDGVAACDVLGSVEVAQLVEVAAASEALFERGATCGGVPALGCVGGQASEDLLADRGVGGEAREERGELLLDLLGGDDRLVAGVVGAATGAVVARLVGAPACAALHARVAAAAAREPAQQVVGRGASGVQCAGALAAHQLHPVVEGLVHDGLVQALDGLAPVAAPGDVARVGGVAEHLAHGVDPKRTVARGALSAYVQPCRERAVGVLTCGVHLK